MVFRKTKHYFPKKKGQTIHQSKQYCWLTTGMVYSIVPYRLRNTLVFGSIWIPKTFRSNTEHQEVFGRLGIVTSFTTNKATNRKSSNMLSWFDWPRWLMKQTITRGWDEKKRCSKGFANTLTKSFPPTNSWSYSTIYIYYIKNTIIHHSSTTLLLISLHIL